MKNASTATQNILAAGEYGIAELYAITPKFGSTVYYFTNFDQPLTCAIYPSVTKNTYVVGLTIKRGDLRQKIGTDSADIDLTVSPQGDNPAGAPTIAGYGFLEACRIGILDNALVQMSKLFYKYPSGSNGTGPIDTSPGAVGWFLGILSDVQAGRLTAKLKASSLLSLMSVQMPRSVFMTGCAHTVYDSGCTLLKSSFTASGTVNLLNTAGIFGTTLTAADTYYNMGVITFTSGANDGLSASVKKYSQSNGVVILFTPLPTAPALGDTFTIYPGCDHQMSTCANSNAALGFNPNNLAHFKGEPFIPIPETMIDGGATNPSAQTKGSQAGQIIGSPPSGKRSQV